MPHVYQHLGFINISREVACRNSRELWGSASGHTGHLMPACSLAVAGRHFFSLRFCQFFRKFTGVSCHTPSTRSCRMLCPGVCTQEDAGWGDGWRGWIQAFIYICLYTHEKDYPLWDDHPNIWNIAGFLIPFMTVVVTIFFPMTAAKASFLQPCNKTQTHGFRCLFWLA